MEALMHSMAVASLVAYIAASLVYLAGLYGYRTWVAGPSFLLGLALHSVALLAMIISGTSVFLENGADYLFLVSWFLAATFVLLRSKLNYPVVGAIGAPIIVLVMASSSYLLHAGSVSVLGDGGQAGEFRAAVITLHALPAVLATVSLALCFVVSIVFLLTDRKLRRRGADILMTRGPSIVALDSINTTCERVGFLGLTLVVLTGSLWAVAEQKPWMQADSTAVLGFVVWLLLAVVMHARTSLDWSPRRITALTLCVSSLYFFFVVLLLFVTGNVTHGTYG